jgi:hypothetical protein
VPQAVGDVGVLFTVLRSERDFGSNGNGADHLEAPGDIGERVLQIAATDGWVRERLPPERTIVRAPRLSLRAAIAGLLGARGG